MADMTLTEKLTGFIVVATSDVEITLLPNFMYQVRNVGGQAVYGSTDGNAVVASTASGADKFLLHALSADAGGEIRLLGVTTLKLKCSASSTVVNVSGFNYRGS